MASSCTILNSRTIKKLNDAVYELYKPPTGPIELEIVFFHGFISHESQNAHVETWMSGDGSACWINTWLPGKFRQSRILSVSYDSSIVVTDSEGRMDMYLVGECLAISVIELARVGESCPVVLVGHGVGGLALKQVCCWAEEKGTMLEAQGHGINSYNSFLNSMRGAFFYSTCQIGSRIQAAWTPRGPLMEYYELLSNKSARLNTAFSELRKRMQYGWKTFGAIEANKTEYCISGGCGSKRQRLVVAEEGSARIDMDDFCVLAGEDHASICRPMDQTSSSFKLIVQFVRGILDNEELPTQWRSSLEFPLVHESRAYLTEVVIRKLQLDEPEPSILYLVGMGGIGKSTLAKEVMVKIRSQFELLCFVDDVKSRLQQHKLHSLTAGELYYSSGLKVPVPNDDSESLWRVLKGKKILLIMDNVDSEEQICSLPPPNWVGRGSRLLITSRERPQNWPGWVRRGSRLPPTSLEGPQELGAHSFLVHEVPFMSGEEAKRLFLAHLDVNTVRTIRGELIDEVVRKCDGLPLTLKITGSFLCFRKETGIWEEIVERLTKAESIDGNRDEKLWSKLRVSFDNLADTERRMFLDLAMFDKSKPDGILYDLQIWRATWNEGGDGSSVRIGLSNLENKFFIHRRQFNVEIRKQGQKSNFRHLASSKAPVFVSIHEQLRDMGRSICRPSLERVERCRGVWQVEDVDNLLVENKGGKYEREVESMTLDHFATSDHSRKLYPWNSIGQLRRLRLIRMSNVDLSGDGAERFPGELALLHMDTCFRAQVERHLILSESDDWPIRAEDVAGLQRLTVLILEDCSCEVLPANFDELKRLRILIIRGEQLRELPKNFGGLQSLEVLILEGVSLSYLPGSFYKLSSLKSFTITECLGLESLVDPGVTSSPKVCWPLKMLTHVRLEILPVLKDLPREFGLLAHLETLSIVGCLSVVELPESCGQLGELKRLHMGGCSALLTLPESFGQLGELRKLYMFSTFDITGEFWAIGKIRRVGHG